MRAILVLSISLAVVATAQASGSTWYVDDSMTSSGDGASWGTAFKRIQEGIDAASEGDTVTVAQGTYEENLQFNGKNIVLTSTDPLNPTVVAGTVIDGGQVGSVVTFLGTETEACVLSGFTIRNGSSPLGGGIRGGLAGDHSDVIIEYNTITGNSATHGAGVIYCDGPIRNNTITGNSAEGNGGGVGQCSGEIRDNTITGNSAGWNGGAMSGCGGTIQNNTIRGNAALLGGGGLYSCNGTIRNNAITGNSGYNGGGLYSCNGAIQNNTITGNSAGFGGGLALCKPATISNCILWANTAPTGPQLSDSSVPAYSCIEGWTGGGTGNISEDPQFVDPDGADNDPATYEDNDYRLSSHSPCIDAGMNQTWMESATDLDGNPRIINGGFSLTVDMGAYEHGPHTPENWYVDGSVSSSGDGKSWGTAFKTIQEGIVGSWGGDTVLVAEGTYVENIHFDGKNIILTSTDPFDPSVVANTIIDGNHAGPVVMFTGSETAACVVSGFTIRNGTAELGGGIRGGTAGNHSDVTIENNTITGNSATHGAGAIYCDGPIRNNTITGNSAVEGGGGLHGCNGTIQNNRISGNSAEWGGGLSACGGPIRNNTIARNSAVLDGGGLAGCNGSIQNNWITGNSAGRSGGGLQRCDGTIQSNAIAGNSSEWGGGLYTCDGSIRNNTIVHNSATQNGGGLSYCSGTVRNCILWRNTAGNGPQLDGSSTPTYSCIQDWTEGGDGNIALDPQFVDPDGPDNDPGTQEDNDYRLSGASPCIDAGMNETWMESATDLDGNPRTLDGDGDAQPIVDMGAYEYIFQFRMTRILQETGGTVTLTWTSRPGAHYVVWSLTDLSGGEWTDEAGMPSQGESTTWTDPSTGGSRKFYRIEQF